MKTLQNQSYYICGCCKLALSLKAFYVNKKTGRPANYCKECRKPVPRICQEYCLLSEEERAEAVKPSKPAAENVAATPDTVTISGDTVTLSHATVTKKRSYKKKRKRKRKERKLPP